MVSNLLILKRLTAILLLFFVFSIYSLKAQCTNGSQAECKCSTAPVLCTIDELDGYTFSMAAFQHPNDGPSPICPGANMSQTNNPTWFAFTAWCTDLSLRVTSTNCQQSQGYIGFQLAIYSNCTFNNLIACNADINDCNTNDKILNLTGLNVGSIYYFMVDGCLGSYCTVSIDIIGVCGQEQIEPWTQPIDGNMNPCAGHTETYTVEDLDGARIYHWFLNGVLAGQTINESFDIAWTTAGTYQLCVDASNDPCVDISDTPTPLCTTIKVRGTDAGILSVTPEFLCPNEVAQISNTGFTTGIGNGQFVITTDATGLILNVRPGGNFQALSDTAGTFTFYAYNYLIPGGTIPVTGGNISDIDCTADCCDIVSQTITYQSIEASVSDIVCDDHGTGNDSTDDTFTFNVFVTSPHTGNLWRSTDGTLQGTYGIPIKCGPYLITGGGLSIDLHDYDAPTCFTTILVDPPLACSFCPQSIDLTVTKLDENCDGENNGAIILTGISSGVPPYAYQLNGGSQDSTGQFTNLAPGGYNLQIKDANGCSVDTFITILPGIHLDLNLPEIIQFNGDQNGLINPTVNVPLVDLQTIQWSPPGTVACDTCLSTIVITKDNQTLHLVVVHIHGCTASKDLDILVIPAPNIYVPNTFSPNGDGFNDFFTLFSNDGVESILEFNIFDRWGEHLYKARNINPNVPGYGWDGKFHQKDMPSGTFVYYLKILLADGTEKKLTGDVTLVR